MNHYQSITMSIIYTYITNWRHLSSYFTYLNTNDAKKFIPYLYRNVNPYGYNSYFFQKKKNAKTPKNYASL